MNDYFNVRSFGAVGDDVANDTAKIQAAINALPSGGGTVYFPPGTYKVATTLTLPDKNVTFDFAAGAKVDIGANVITLFRIPDIITTRRVFLFQNPTLIGGSVAGQVCIANADSSSRAEIQILNPDITGFETPINITAGDVTFNNPAVVQITDGRIFPVDLAGSVLVKTPASAGTYAFAIGLFIKGTLLDSGTNAAFGIDFDGDLMLADVPFLKWKGTSQTNGFSVSGSITTMTGVGGGSFEIFGEVWYEAHKISGLSFVGFFLSTTLKISSFNPPVSIAMLEIRSATLVVNALNVSISQIKAIANALTVLVAVDILVDADHCTIDGGSLSAGTTAKIRTAALSGCFTGISFTASGGINTILEVAGANKTIVAGCSGVSQGGGFTLVGAQSLCDVTVANVAT